MSQTNPGARRRVNVTRVRAAATRVLQDTARTVKKTPAHTDASLLTACLAYAEVRRRTHKLRVEGNLGEAALKQAHAELHESASLALADVATYRASTSDGHRARAATVLTWDEGELGRLVEKYGILQDRLILALLIDLVGL